MIVWDFSNIYGDFAIFWGFWTLLIFYFCDNSFLLLKFSFCGLGVPTLVSVYHDQISLQARETARLCPASHPYWSWSPQSFLFLGRLRSSVCCCPQSTQSPLKGITCLIHFLSLSFIDFFLISPSLISLAISSNHLSTLTDHSFHEVAFIFFNPLSAMKRAGSSLTNFS